MCLASIAILVSASAAIAQTSAYGQYGPTLDAAGIIQSDAVGGGGDGAAGGSVAGETQGAAGGGAGELPFTGYPLTSLVLIALLLLGGGLMLRLLLLPALGRRRA
jgi:hypothetical protein